MSKERAKGNFYIGGYLYIGCVSDFYDSVNDVRMSGSGADVVNEKCTVANATKGAGTWVVIPGGGGASAFTDLTDVPASYAGQGGKVVSVKADVSGLEFTAPSGGASDITDLTNSSTVKASITDSWYFQLWVSAKTWYVVTFTKLKEALGLNITATKTLTVTDDTTLGGGSHSGNNTGDQVGDGVTITGAGTIADPFVAVGGSSNIDDGTVDKELAHWDDGDGKWIGTGAAFDPATDIIINSDLMQTFTIPNLHMYPYTIKFSGIATSATVTGAGTINEVLLNGVAQSFPFSFSQGDKIAITLTGGTVASSANLIGRFLTTTFANPLVSQDKYSQAFLCTETADYYVYMLWNQAVLTPATATICMVILVNKSTGLETTYIASQTGVDIIYHSSLACIICSRTTTATDTTASLIIYNDLTFEEKNIYTYARYLSRKIIVVKSGTTYIISSPNNSNIIAYEFANPANTYTAAFVRYTDGCWNGIDNAATGMLYVSRDATSIYKIKSSDFTASATIYIGATYSQFLNNTPDANGLIWLCNTTKLYSIAAVAPSSADDTLTTYDSSRTIHNSPGIAYYNTRNYYHQTKQKIYCGQYDGTIFIEFDIATTTFTETDLSGIIPAGYKIFTVQCIESLDEVYVCCYLITGNVITMYRHIIDIS